MGLIDYKLPHGSDRSHEQTYHGLNLVASIHRTRLKHFFRLLHSLQLPPEASIADFGCSNGYFISLMQDTYTGNRYSYFGFDCDESLLSQAKSRNLSSCEFNYFDLNTASAEWNGRFDLVICLETMEHTGDFRNALANLYACCRRNGLVIISTPNEKGLPGLLKYFGRKILRRNAYGDFFKDQSEVSYLGHLLSGKSLNSFRSNSRQMWGPHLGFDWKIFDKHLTDTFVKSGKFDLLQRTSSFLNFGYFFVLRKRS